MNKKASMLVFLALLLQPKNPKRLPKRHSSFNACFPGSITATNYREILDDLLKLLQCLFSWLYYCNTVPM